MHRSSFLLCCLLLATACQAPAPVNQAPISQAPAAPVQILQASQMNKPQFVPYVSPVLEQIKFEPQAKVSIQGTQVQLQIQLPPLPSRANFQTQALYLANAAQITATVSDSHGKSYTPVGADGLGRVAYPVSGVITLTFNNVVPDPLLFVELQVRDASADIPQADLAAVISHTTSSNATATVNFQTTATAKAMKTLRNADADRARSINLADLTTLMSTITGQTGTDPNFTYTTHPSLVNTGLLATDLASQLPGALTAANYRLTGATVSLDVSGLVGTDKLDVQITDAASVMASNLGNGNAQLINRATPGNGLAVRVGFAAGNSVQYTFTATPSTVNLSNGNTTSVAVVATPAALNITSLSSTASAIGSTITINGTGFSTVMGNNQVRFGTTSATVTSASATQLQVTVPAGISGSQPVTVQVGATTSNSSPFSVVPTLTTLSASTGSTGDSLTLTGTGFSTTMANNTVRFGTISATVTAATATSLTVTLTEAPAGTANATVQVGTQTSNSLIFTRLPRLSSLTTAEALAGKAVLVRSRNLTIAGTNFDLTPANNEVRFTLSNSTVVTATPSSASATSLVVAVPSGVDLAGDVGVVVRSNSQNSNSLTGLVPTLSLNVTNGGFH